MDAANRQVCSISNYGKPLTQEDRANALLLSKTPAMWLLLSHVKLTLDELKIDYHRIESVLRKQTTREERVNRKNA
jgi:hypothetical protein